MGRYGSNNMTTGPLNNEERIAVQHFVVTITNRVADLEVEVDKLRQSVLLLTEYLVPIDQGQSEN
jgi:alkylhydroperoxidase family enzyme